jgi:hypothetical protein
MTPQDVAAVLREHWFHDGGDLCECGYWAHLDSVKRHHIEDVLAGDEVDADPGVV